MKEQIEEMRILWKRIVIDLVLAVSLNTKTIVSLITVQSVSTTQATASKSG